jgi:EAL and modified HD-GYP domain-containing signal transduction protein
VLLTSSLLKNANREDIERVLKFAFLMKELAQRIVPEHEEEAYMVGILEPVRLEIGDEIKEILDKAGVSEYVVSGLLEPNSRLGKLKEAAKVLLSLCDSLTEGKPVKIPDSLSPFTKEELTEACIVAQDNARSILATL